MNRALIDELLAHQAAKTPLALATFLKTGEQRLLFLFGKKGLEGIDPRIGEAARAAILADKSSLYESEDGQVFITVFNPPLRLFLIGAVHIAQALAPMARLVGFDVTVIDPRQAFASIDRFPGIALSHAWPDEALAEARLDYRSAIITLTHDPKLDDPALTAAMKSDAFYIGALGSKKTHAARLSRLEAQGFASHDLRRISGPVGLAIGAVTPAEIAVSALAQVIGSLRMAKAATSG